MPANVITYLMGYTTLLLVLLIITSLIYSHYYSIQTHLARLGYQSIAESIAGQIITIYRQGYNSSTTLKYPVYGPDGSIYDIIIGYGSAIKQIFPVMKTQGINDQYIYVVVKSGDGRYYWYRIVSSSSNIILGNPGNQVNYYMYSSSVILRIETKVIKNYTYITIQYMGLRKT